MTKLHKHVEYCVDGGASPFLCITHVDHKPLITHVRISVVFAIKGLSSAWYCTGKGLGHLQYSPVFRCTSSIYHRGCGLRHLFACWSVGSFSLSTNPKEAHKPTGFWSLMVVWELHCPGSRGKKLGLSFFFRRNCQLPRHFINALS